MIRTFALLLALLVLAAAPARAQQSASFAPAATPLPALLQPAPRTEPRAAADEPVIHMVRGAAVGAGMGCLVVGILAALVDTDPEPPSSPQLKPGLYGCAVGALGGGVLGGSLALISHVIRPD